MTPKPYSLLVVDDDTRIRELLSDFLKSHGFQVTVAHNAEEAFRMIEIHAIDLLIVDVMMPKQTGIELTQVLRKVSSVPVIMLTALGEVEDRIKGLLAGANDYIAKPFEPQELVLRIRNILDHHSPTAMAQPKVARGTILIGSMLYHKATRSLHHFSRHVHLSSQEQLLLDFLTASLGTVVSREAIGAHLGGLSESAVNVIVARLRLKLEPHSPHPLYLKTIRQHGYVLFGVDGDDAT